MARLIYIANASLDGFTEDAEGRFDFMVPDHEYHGYVNELVRPLGTLLYGRRMYETMAYWEANGDEPEDPPVERDFATLWRAAEKVVYSASLDAVETARTRLERSFDAEAVRALKASAPTDVGIGGPTIAAAAFAAGLIDQVDLFVSPIAVGGGRKPALPAGQRIALELTTEHRLASGVVHLGYRVCHI
ncbi:dihydrofolate reductase family protein [Conexibacter sp. JD483]|uniref:dihydrofolate reductase family protein n=1 Tax=unclassified Conexibacter TaxID=2627773 RepID=UPI002725AA6A|nr:MULTISPECIES: dihydrofolate reductase family protein [unclassified Conexibacter]MDO8186927.1 dihydrofolate reductase family protein [Conexibacter sp. CPCC 205706]MDO8200618.1 dihydrofolate reductase family protein [Conexibacter sp. CPCC 205762]MDR9368804.1 dihydrofolate reductase family protein [Conexibacter sp. JD483]